MHFQFLSARPAGSHAYKLLLGYSLSFTLVAENSRCQPQLCGGPGYLCPPNLLLTLLGKEGPVLGGRSEYLDHQYVKVFPAPLPFQPPS